jgi:ATP-dependent DNA ligase
MAVGVFIGLFTRSTFESCREHIPVRLVASELMPLVRYSTSWLKPQAVAQIEFLDWTGADHLRHTRFAALRDDKDPRKVVREGVTESIRSFCT